MPPVQRVAFVCTHCTAYNNNNNNNRISIARLAPYDHNIRGAELLVKYFLWFTVMKQQEF